MRKNQDLIDEVSVLLSEKEYTKAKLLIEKASKDSFIVGHFYRSKNHGYISLCVSVGPKSHVYLVVVCEPKNTDKFTGGYDCADDREIWEELDMKPKLVGNTLTFGPK